MRAPARLAGHPRPDPTPGPRLTRLAPDLWLDLDTVTAVRHYTAPATYTRMVVLHTTDGLAHKIPVAHTAGGHRPASEGDRVRDDWIRGHLADILRDLP